jgi:hypothetical protein
MKQLNSLPIEGKKHLINMGISTASVFLAIEVGELAKQYQVWHNKWLNRIQGQVDLYPCSPK